MSAPTNADMDHLAEVLARLLADWWRKHAQDHQTPREPAKKGVPDAH
jgi:hypothetical protein